MILLLTELPHVIDKLRQEQDTIVNTHGETLNMDALTDMKYADAVIREVLRLLGPSRGVWRRAMHDVPLFGKVVPAGSLMFISTDGAHALDPAVMGGENFDHMDVYNLEASFKPGVGCVVVVVVVVVEVFVCVCVCHVLIDWHTTKYTHTHESARFFPTPFLPSPPPSTQNGG